MYDKKFISANIVIDEQLDEESIENNLDKLVMRAKKQGSALGYVQGYILSMKTIKNWIPSLEQHGVKLVTVSDLLQE
jgi:polysaccharide deacetylase 2 family uncharacterized protein YibQ